MNYRFALRVIGNVLKYETLLLFIPLLVTLIYRENPIGFIATILISGLASLILCRIKIDKQQMYAKEGFITVGIAWIMISVVGALPFVIDGSIPSFVDAFFETVSGFTTTGATILTEVESLPKGILFWRSFTHWIGGMGILIFMLALIPSLGSSTIHLIKAESPGPNPGKIVTKLKETANILYIIYFLLTIVQTILLVMAGLPLYDSLITALGTAGTGGFSNMNASIGAYHNSAVDWIVTVFMIIFGINFALYYQVLKGNIKNALRNEELKFYALIIVSAIALISFNIYDFYGRNLGETIRLSSFQVASIVTSTGYATADFNLWPSVSRTIIVFLMLVGAMAGSTGGGIKTIRVVIMLKAIKREINKILHPKRIQSVKIDGKVVGEETISGVFLFIGAYTIIALIAMFILSFDGFDLVTTSTSVITTLSNIGPGLNLVGPTGNFSIYSSFSKIVLSFCMLAGRLEIYPMLILFSPSLWRKNY